MKQNWQSVVIKHSMQTDAFCQPLPQKHPIRKMSRTWEWWLMNMRMRIKQWHTLVNPSHHIGVTLTSVTLTHSLVNRKTVNDLVKPCLDRSLLNFYITNTVSIILLKFPTCKIRSIKLWGKRIKKCTYFSEIGHLGVYCNLHSCLPSQRAYTFVLCKIWMLFG